MTGSAYNAMDVLHRCESLLKGRGLGKGGQSDDGKRIYAMDVFSTCESLLIG